MKKLARHGRSSLLIAFLLSVTAMVPRDSEGSEYNEIQQWQDESDYPCAVLALSTLLHLEGLPTPPDQVATRLVRRRTHSLSEIRDAATSFGLPLRGVKIELGGSLLDRPALVQLKRGPSGHFVVIRPVGHSGKLIQVLDPTTSVRVEDAEALSASGEWTGLALVPTRSANRVSIVLAVAGTISFCYFTYLLIRKSQKS